MNLTNRRKFWLVAILLIPWTVWFSAQLPAQNPQPGGNQDVMQPQPADNQPAPVDAPPVRPPSMLLWLVRVSGAIGVVIFLLSIYFLKVVVMQFVELRQEYATPTEVLDECDKYLKTGNIEELSNLVRADDSFFAAALSAGVAQLRFSLDEARESLERKAEAITIGMEKQISILATIGTLGPMIGLLGTLKGMIGSFMAIALSGQNLEASRVAEGISEALVLTFEGVALSIPAIYFYALFKNRIAAISAETTQLADDYLRAINRSIRQPSPTSQVVGATSRTAPLSH